MDNSAIKEIQDLEAKLISLEREFKDLKTKKEMIDSVIKTVSGCPVCEKCRELAKLALQFQSAA